MLVEERLELGTGWLIDDILSERRWKGGHRRSISGAPATSKLPLIGNAVRLAAWAARDAGWAVTGGHEGWRM